MLLFFARNFKKGLNYKPCCIQVDLHATSVGFLSQGLETRHKHEKMHLVLERYKLAFCSL